MNRKLFIVLIVMLAVLFAFWYAINERRAEQNKLSMHAPFISAELNQDTSLRFCITQNSIVM